MRRIPHSPPEMSPAVFADRRGWWAALGFAFLVLVFPGFGCTPAESGSAAGEVGVADLPREVRAALDRAARVYPQPLSGADWSNAYLLGGTDHPLYQLRGKNARGSMIELEVTAAGRVIEVEEHGIPLGEVPTAVVEALKARMPEFDPVQVEAIYQAEGPRPTSYGFEGKDTAGQTIEVYISADGKTFLN